MNDCIKVGARVRRGDGYPWVEVLFVGERSFFGRDEDGMEAAWNADATWEPFVEPVVFPELWINVWDHTHPIGPVYMSRVAADIAAKNAAPALRRLGVIHLYPDGTLELEDA